MTEGTGMTETMTHTASDLLYRTGTITGPGPDTERKLPTTTKEMDELVARVTALAGVPNNDRTYDAIATMIMHMGPTVSEVPDSHFAKGAIKTLANEAAYTRILEIAERRKAAEENKKLKLVTTETNAESVEPLQNA